MAYSSDLKTWEWFPIPENEWYGVYYHSSSGYYCLYGDSPYLVRWKEVTNYDTGTYFMLPTANSQHDLTESLKRKNYIRVK